MELTAGDSLEGSDDTPMYNPHVIPLKLRSVFSNFWGMFWLIFFRKLAVLPKIMKLRIQNIYQRLWCWGYKTFTTDYEIEDTKHLPKIMKLRIQNIYQRLWYWGYKTFTKDYEIEDTKHYHFYSLLYKFVTQILIYL